MKTRTKIFLGSAHEYFNDAAKEAQKQIDIIENKGGKILGPVQFMIDRRGDARFALTAKVKVISK